MWNNNLEKDLEEIYYDLERKLVTDDFLNVRIPALISDNYLNVGTSIGYSLRKEYIWEYPTDYQGSILNHIEKSVQFRVPLSIEEMFKKLYYMPPR